MLFHQPAEYPEVFPHFFTGLVKCFSDCQHPGSSGCPQQFCRLSILIALFRSSEQIFLPRGIVAFRFVKKSLILGF
jgi:hypothetical protein